ncbi:MAG: hypothetical protein GTO14_23895 [Anaerolineales bacterium]|nr:hypothetical protein [Anaerolineales bacterium]
MDCPIDGTALETHTVQSVNVDECTQCRGLWFDLGELRKAKNEAAPDLKWLDFDLWSDHESFGAEWSAYKCPHCGGTMAAISYAATGVTIDYCVRGHGMWLDHGEFQAILDALEKETLSKDVSDYIAASLEEAKEIFTGEKGFISEWKDFLTVSRLFQYRVLSENPKVAELLIALQSTSPFK